jgi:outer membrane protein assembly factor BamB
MRFGPPRRMLATLCLVTFSATLVSADDWPQWRGPHRDGRSTETGLSKDWNKQPPKHLWTVGGMGRGFASLSIVKGHIYTTGNIGGSQAVICVDAASGAPVWSTPITQGNPRHDYEGSRGTPTVDGDRVYAVSSDGGIACLQTRDGSIVWKRPFSEFGGRLMSGWGFSEAPLVDGKLVVCTPGGSNAIMVALDKISGELVWSCPMPAGGDRGGDGAGYSSIVISNGGGVKQYVQIVGRGLIGVRASDGEFLWGYNKVANGTANIPTPLVSGDYVFAATGYDTGAALVKLSKKGKSVQPSEEYFLNANVFQNHHGGMVLIGDYIYGGNGNNNGFPTCINWKTGKIKWGGKLRGAGGGSAAVTAFDDQLIFRYQDGKLALISATPDGYSLNGTLTPDYQEGESWSHPVIVDGKMYLREQDKLMCYDVKS